jgi:hypothetical protein
MCALEFKFELKTFEFKFEQKGKVFKPPQNPWTLFPSSRPNSISFLSFSPTGPAQFSYELFPLCPLINHQMHWWPINSHYDIKLCNNPLLINTHASNSNNSHHFQSKEKRKMINALQSCWYISISVWVLYELNIYPWIQKLLKISWFFWFIENQSVGFKKSFLEKKIKIVKSEKLSNNLEKSTI